MNTASQHCTTLQKVPRLLGEHGLRAAHCVDSRHINQSVSFPVTPRQGAGEETADHITLHPPGQKKRPTTPNTCTSRVPESVTQAGTALRSTVPDAVPAAFLVNCFYSCYALHTKAGLQVEEELPINPGL